MDYHLSHNGENLGIFGLEELRQRRSRGKLTGTEFVWADGMSDWETLDVVLQATPVENPPPLPSSVSRRPSRRLIIGLAIGAGLVMLAGGLTLAIMMARLGHRVQQTAQRASEEDATAIASEPILASTNSLTVEKVVRRAGEFRLLQYLEGYKAHGQRNPSWDAPALELLQSWLAFNYGGTGTNLPPPAELAEKLARSPGCEDGLVLTVIAVNIPDIRQRIHFLEQALRAFQQSKHTAYPKFYATVTLANALVSEQPQQVAVLDGAALKLFTETLADNGIRTEDQAEIAETLIAGWGRPFFQRNSEAVMQQAARAGESFHWLSLVLAGEYHINKAWKARGGGYADTVSESGWKGFSTHLSAAREALTSAWELRPDLPLAASRMISVALGDSGIGQMRVWFDRALEAQIDHPDSWSNMRWGLRPRWHGDHEAMLALGVAALETERFDTDIPRKLMDVISDLAEELDLPQGEYLYGRPDIWPHVQRMYEGYLSEPSQGPQRQGWRTSYAVAAFLARQYDLAQTQLEALNWEPQPRNLTGWRIELSLMPLEVAARTSPAGERIARAEASRAGGEISSSLELFRAILAEPDLDERTQRFIGHRLASLETEKKLEKGDWVDFMPRGGEDPGWKVFLGQCQQLPDGALEVRSAADGHFLYSRARVGWEFEVKGEFEVAHSSNGNFQAGLVMGLMDPGFSSWFGCRIKRNGREGDVLSFGREWSTAPLRASVTLKSDHNSFHLRLSRGKVSTWINGQQVSREADPLIVLRVSNEHFLVGLGAANDGNDTVLRYRHLQVRRLTR